MNELLKYYTYIFLALRVFIDLIVSIIIYYQIEALLNGIGLMVGCSVFSLFLYFGIRKEEFRGRYGRRVCLIGEPFAYWFVFAFLVLSHLTVTGLMIRIINW